jgi:putative ABC transport system permease protein
LFEDVAAANETGFDLSGGGHEARQLAVARVTYNLFSILRVKPVVGSLFLPEEDRPGADHVVLLSYAAWQSDFRGDPGVVGRTIRFNDEPYVVKGVMPAGFSFPDKEPNLIDAWVPRGFTAEELTARRARYLLVIGRLRPGVSIDQVNAVLSVLERQNSGLYPSDMQGVSRYFAEPLRESYGHDVKRGLLLLMASVGVILLIACANVANLFLSRAAGRRREIALRLALGAGANRIVRQLLTESGVLSATGSLLGVGLAASSLGALRHVLPNDLSHTAPLSLNVPVFGFSILVSLACALLFGLAPALQLVKSGVNDDLRQGARGSTGSRQLLGSALVSSSIALSLMLLVCAGLLLKGLSKLQHVDPGFQASGVLPLDFGMGQPSFRDWSMRTRFVERVLDGVRALPGVRSAGLAGGVPFTARGGLREQITPQGSSVWSEVPDTAVYRVVMPGYLETLQVPLERGRMFDSRDREDAPLVVLVNRKAAREFWPNQDPIGKRLKLGAASSEAPWRTVVGVVGDVREAGLNEPVWHEIYCPYRQSETSWQWVRFLAVRTVGDPMAALNSVRRVVAKIDADVALNHVMTLDRIVQRDISQSAAQTALLIMLAALALIMASVGIYGVMAYLVSQRTKEIGVRVALGAQRGQILGMVLQRGMILTAIGVAVGISGALALTRLIGSILYGVSPTDAFVMITAGTLLSLVALAACLIPASRATRIDPVEALRLE